MTRWRAVAAPRVDDGCADSVGLADSVGPVVQPLRRQGRESPLRPQGREPQAARGPITESALLARHLAIVALEAETTAALNATLVVFDRVVQSLAYATSAPTATPDQLGVAAPFVEQLNRRTVAMLGSAGANDLRRVAAILHVTRCLERIVARLAELAGLVCTLAPLLSRDPRASRTTELEVVA